MNTLILVINNLQLARIALENHPVLIATDKKKMPQIRFLSR